MQVSTEGSRETTYKGISMRIRILDDETIGKIAAGEVIERPASIVKELIENSLDAAARRVAVEVEGGGMKNIRVSDDGCGMSGEEIRMALERHATSKIVASDDLWRIRTYGFRGEALSSIGAVSRLEIISKQNSDVVGHRFVTEAMKEMDFTEYARRDGTTVTVSNLFFNSPARRKFLRSAATEFRHILRTFISYALAQIDVEFTLKRDGKPHLDIPRAGSLTERIDSLYSEQYSKKLLEVFSTEGELTLGGFVIDPNLARKRGAEQWIFVNGRPCYSRSLIAAVHEGYRTTLPRGTSPDFILFLTVPPSDVDVNVHPTKREVNFRNHGLVFDIVSSSIKKTLGSQKPDATSFGDLHRLKAGKYLLRDSHTAEPLGHGDRATKQMALFMNTAASRKDSPTQAQESMGKEALLTQLHRMYIVATTEAGIAVVDQHAAHERIIYEELIEAFQKGNVDSQRLLFPLTIYLSHQEEMVLEEYGSLLNKFGFLVEPFGDNTYLLRAVPSVNPGYDIESSIHSILSDLSEKGMHEMNQYERIAKVISCRTAIKAGVTLHQDQMSEMLDALFATKLPYSDIHGRPTIIYIDLDELERRFGRS
ncbi:MAG: DNA mismatch repair endonuclease MutL [Candidatus Glassbacteria bacterium]